MWNWGHYRPDAAANCFLRICSDYYPTNLDFVEVTVYHFDLPSIWSQLTKLEHFKSDVRMTFHPYPSLGSLKLLDLYQFRHRKEFVDLTQNWVQLSKWFQTYNIDSLTYCLQNWSISPYDLDGQSPYFSSKRYFQVESNSKGIEISMFNHICFDNGLHSLLSVTPAYYHITLWQYHNMPSTFHYIKM